MPVPVNQTTAAAQLFARWEDTMIWSCLQGIMGEIWVDDLQVPNAAMARLGDFAFFTGIPNEALLQLCASSAFWILVPQHAAWSGMIERCFPDRAARMTRYAFEKTTRFDRQTLRQAAALLPAGYEMAPLDEPLYHWCMQRDWCRDWVALYPDYAAYQRLGLGVVVLRDGEPVAGASSYSRYAGGIEIQIDTRADFRRRGLGRACAAQLMLECLERGLYPSWDAQNPGSAALAETLGYRLKGTYPAYELRGGLQSAAV